MTFLPVGAELFHAYGQTDMKRLIVALRNFTNAPKIVKLHTHYLRGLTTLEPFLPVGD